MLEEAGSLSPGAKVGQKLGGPTWGPLQHASRCGNKTHHNGTSSFSSCPISITHIPPWEPAMARVSHVRANSSSPLTLQLRKGRFSGSLLFTKLKQPSGRVLFSPNSQLPFLRTQQHSAFRDSVWESLPTCPLERGSYRVHCQGTRPTILKPEPKSTHNFRPFTAPWRLSKCPFPGHSQQWESKSVHFKKCSIAFPAFTNNFPSDKISFSPWFYKYSVIWMNNITLDSNRPFEPFIFLWIWKF